MRLRLDLVENNSSLLSEIVYNERDKMSELKQRVHTVEGASKILENEVSAYFIVIWSFWGDLLYLLVDP